MASGKQEELEFLAPAANETGGCETRGQWEAGRAGECEKLGVVNRRLQRTRLVDARRVASGKQEELEFAAPAANLRLVDARRVASGKQEEPGIWRLQRTRLVDARRVASGKQEEPGIWRLQRTRLVDARRVASGKQEELEFRHLHEMRPGAARALPGGCAGQIRDASSLYGAVWKG